MEIPPAQQAQGHQGALERQQGRRRPGPVLLPGTPAHRPDPPPQAEAPHQAQQGQRYPQGREIPGPDGGVHHPSHIKGGQIQQAQPPAEGKPAVFPPQGAEPQEQQHHSHGGEQVVQVPEVQGQGGQAGSPHDAHHGPPPGVHLRHRIVGQGQRGQLLLQHPVKFPVVTHPAHLPAPSAGGGGAGAAGPPPPAGSAPAPPPSGRWTGGSSISGTAAPAPYRPARQ